MRYQSPKQKKPLGNKSNPFFTLMLLLLMLVIGYKLISKPLYHTNIIHPQQTPHNQQLAPSSFANTHPTEQTWVHYRIKPGDSMAKIFNRLHLDPQDLHTIMRLGDTTNALATLHLGQQLDLLISINPDKQQRYKILRAIHLQLNLRDTLIITSEAGKYKTEIYKQPIENKTELATATIQHSFLMAGNNAKIPQTVLHQIISLFSWRIDFKRDIRKGDNYTVIYDEQYLNGKKLKTGNIIAAEFVNKGNHYYAIRFSNKNNDIRYYDSKGASVRKAFLRRPVTTGYISSPFNMRRRHPILGYLRPHTGTDFAATYGTPIHATGDGRIMLAGRKGGYGRCVMIRHGSRIITLYAHMSRYAHDLKVGQYVKQGQVIGYVGSSGLSTGPHVHYEFRINGKFYDPMKVRLPNAAPIPKSERTTYLTFAKTISEKLNNYRHDTVSK